MLGVYYTGEFYLGQSGLPFNIFETINIVSVILHSDADDHTMKSDANTMILESDDADAIMSNEVT